MSDDAHDGRDDRAAGERSQRESGAQRPLSDEERMALYREQVKQIHVIEIVRATVLDLVTLGYQKLGLAPETRELRDLDDARVAIETLRRLVEVLAVEGGADEARTYRSTLAAMQLQFATAAAEETVSAPAAPEPARPEPAAPKPVDEMTEPPEPPPASARAAKKPAKPRAPRKKKPAGGAKS